jgi:hypothetical protein
VVCLHAPRRAFNIFQTYQYFAFETNDLNLRTANFDSYGNVSFDPCEFTLHTAANAENND